MAHNTTTTHDNTVIMHVTINGTEVTLTDRRPEYTGMYPYAVQEYCLGTGMGKGYRNNTNYYAALEAAIEKYSYIVDHYTR